MQDQPAWLCKRLSEIAGMLAIGITEQGGLHHQPARYQPEHEHNWQGSTKGQEPEMSKHALATLHYKPLL
jgi:hypothetical protein